MTAGAVSSVTLDHQDPSLVAAILGASSDVTVLLTSDGVICDKVIASPEMPSGLFVGWPGKALLETVTVESRSKIDQMLREAGNGQMSGWRQINHPLRGSADIAVNYSAVRVGPAGHIVAFGRDLSAMSGLQKRLLAAEQAAEQEYQRMRNAETRYRMLLQSASDAILIVDASGGRVSESNEAAATLLNRPHKRLQGAVLEDLLARTDLPAVRAALDSLRSSGRAEDIVLNLGGDQQQAVMSFSLFRQENITYYLLRLVPHMVGGSAVVMPRAQSKVVKVISEMPTGFVVADAEAKVLTANGAFLELAQLASEEQARGVRLERWLGRQGVDFNLMLSQLQEKGEIRNFETVMRGQYGAIDDVEVCAVAITESETPVFGFTINSIGRPKAAAGAKSEKPLLRTVDEFTKLVGKLPLKDLVRESTDIIERLCIEAALQINGDNRASAAEMLGLSRQSLYMKLHRYGIDN